MKLNVTTQVLSETVAKAIRLTGGKAAFETAYFFEKMDQFFDCLNVSSYTAGKRHRKPFQQPYRSFEDFRLLVSIFYQSEYFLDIVHSFSKRLFHI